MKIEASAADDPSIFATIILLTFASVSEAATKISSVRVVVNA